MLGRKRAARFLKEGVQNNREGFERANGVDEPTPRRISAPAKPRLLLQTANSSDNQILHIETQWNPTDTDGKEEPASLQLVRPAENLAADLGATSSGKNRRVTKQLGEKSAKHDSKSGTKKKSAKQKTSKHTPIPTAQPDDELDMTGWSGDYTLPK
jgi:hypothetical protein